MDDLLAGIPDGAIDCRSSNIISSITRALTILPTTDPGGIIQLRDRQFAAELIGAALLHYDLFSWLAENEEATPEQVAAHFEIVERPLDVLLTLCRANGYLTSDTRNGLHLTTTAREHLAKGSPWFLGLYFTPIKDTPIVRGFLSVLSTGKPGTWQATPDGKDWHESMLDPEFARDFTALMNCRGTAFGQMHAAALGPHLEGRRRLLDVAGGSGIYSSTVVAAHPQLTAMVLEQAPVDELTRSEIARHGLGGRVEVVTVDMFEGSWPHADVVLLSNVLHDCSEGLRALRAQSVFSFTASTVGG